jgi:hypothetical protein
MQTDAFAPQATTTQTTEESTNPLNLLVGEGKKFRSVEDLAKGKLEADRFIEQLLREKAEQQETLTKLTTEAQVQQSISQETPLTNTKSKVGESPDIKALVQQTITELFAERETQNNVVEVNKKLQSTFGDRAADIVAQRASELNVGVEFLRSVAAKSPTAFYKLLDTTGAAQPSGSVAQSTVTTPSGSGDTKTSRTWADYMAMKKANPKLYHSPTIQREIYLAYRDGKLTLPNN